MVLIFDEVISGFRVAPGGAAERLGITPDLGTYGKIIGGGMPVGLYGGRKDIMGVVAPDGPVYQAGTLSGNPVAMAAGLATMEKLTPAFYARPGGQCAKWAAAFETIPGLHCPRYGSLLWPLFQDGVRRSDAVKGEAISTSTACTRPCWARASICPPAATKWPSWAPPTANPNWPTSSRPWPPWPRISPDPPVIPVFPYAFSAFFCGEWFFGDVMTQPLLRVLNGETLDKPPVWFMRQAGRFLPEYRAVRAKVTFEQLLTDSDLAAEVTLQPIRRFPQIDGAIIFSDILVILDALGCEVTIPEGGPRIGKTLDQIDINRPLDESIFDPVCAAIRKVRANLPAKVTMLGFAGAPWTLLAYGIEGKGSKSWAKAKAFIHQEPVLARKWMDKLADAAARLLNLHIEAGAQGVQLFDTWAGELDADDYATFALPAVARTLSQVTAAPTLFFARTGYLRTP